MRFTKHVYCYLLVAVCTSPGFAQTRLRVDSAATDPDPDGSTWVKAFPTLYEALELAAGDLENPYEIWVAAGAYFPIDPSDPNPPTRSNTFNLGNNVRVFGGFLGNATGGGETALTQRNPEINETILSGDLDQDDDGNADGIPDDFPFGTTFGDNVYHVVTFSGVGSTSKLSGFIIRGGYADGTGTDESDGGGILVLLPGEGGPLLNRLVLEYNFAQGNPDNEMYPADAGGGGVCIKGIGTASLANCDFRQNYVKVGFGGGLLAIKTSGPSCQMQNCIFIHNTVDRGSGGGASAEGHAFVNLTFYGNQLLQEADGWDPATAFYRQNPGEPGYPSSTSLRNSIIWGNPPPTGESWYQMEGAAAIHCDIEDGHFWQPDGGTQSYGNISADPKFRDEPIDLRLRPTSPANNTGESALVLVDATDVDDLHGNSETTPWDLAKIKRIVNVVEMGAFETCIGDLDNDLDVDVTDLAQMLSSFGMPPNCPTGQYCAAGVENAAIRNGAVVLTLESETSDFSFVAQAMIANRLRISEIKQEEANLEAAFMRLTKGVVQ